MMNPASIMECDTSSHVQYQHLIEKEGTTAAVSRRHVIWRASNAVMTIFFALSAYVQINDAWPCLWVSVYLIPCLLTATIVVKPQLTESWVWQIVSVIHLSLCIAGTVYKAIMVFELVKEEIHNPLIHMEGRELAGLAIVVLWLGLCRFTSVGSSESVGGISKSLLLMTFVIGAVPLLLWMVCFIEDLGKEVGHCQDMFPGLLGQPLL